MQSRGGGAHCVPFTDWYVLPAFPEHLPPAGPGVSGYVSPPFPKPEYQAGELSHYEHTAEHGYHEHESEEQGAPPHPPPLPFPPGPPPPPFVNTHEAAFTSFQYPRPPYWGFYPYYYDYRLLRGQYPPGTYTHATASFERGHDGWKDVHYLRENIPYQDEPVQQSDPWRHSAASQPGKVPQVYTGL